MSVHHVYFVKRAGVVKIGTTRNLRSRLSGFGEYEFLGALPGDATKERELHERFTHLAIPHNGHELFVADQELLDFIVDHRTVTELPPRQRPAPPEGWWYAKHRQGRT